MYLLGLSLQVHRAVARRRELRALQRARVVGLDDPAVLAPPPPVLAVPLSITIRELAGRGPLGLHAPVAQGGRVQATRNLLHIPSTLHEARFTVPF